jgi:hypothetical protein
MILIYLRVPIHIHLFHIFYYFVVVVAVVCKSERNLAGKNGVKLDSARMRDSFVEFSRLY